jgi:hypothetical protein
MAHTLHAFSLIIVVPRKAHHETEERNMGIVKEHSRKAEGSNGGPRRK